MRPSGRVTLSAIAVLALLFAAACSDDSNADPPAGETPGATAPTLTPAALAAEPTPLPPTPTTSAGFSAPDGDRILDRVKYLSDTIGPRPAGTPREQAAIDYIAAQLRAFGYEVEIQEFSIATQTSRESVVTLTAPAEETISSLPLGLSGSGTAEGRLVAAGIGRPSEFPAAVRDNIALIERGELTFQEKVDNAVAAGASAVVIVNNEPGYVLGILSVQSSIPVVSISREDGQELAADVDSMTLLAKVTVGELSASTARNIVARPPGGECETISGGHYDSVPQAPGASDNATGTATVIEIAGVLAADGDLGHDCFVLFGAEELGLLGSQAFVAAMTQAERGNLKAMLNFDMVGVGEDGWLLIGTQSLQAATRDLAAGLGIETIAGNLPARLGSDHQSFLNAGLPAVMFHRLTDPLLHTPEDVSARVRPELLEDAAEMGVALLEALAGSSGGG